MRQEYAFACMSVWIMEGQLITSQQWQRLLQSEDLAEAERVLRETAYGPYLNKQEEGDYETAINQAYVAKLQELKSLVEDPALDQLLSLKEDIHNLKILIKEGEAGKEGAGPDEDLLLPAGSLTTDQIRILVQEGTKLTGPGALNHAVQEGVASWQAKQDPQALDLILDGAYAAILQEAVQELKDPFLARYAEHFADATNVVSFFRSHKQGQSRDFLARVLLPGGRIAEGSLLSLKAEDSAAVMKLLAQAELSPAFLQAVHGYYEDGQIWQLEKARDLLILAMAQEAIRQTPGPAVLLGYRLLLDQEVTNLRILLHGKKAKLAGEEIEKRMRLAYV